MEHIVACRGFGSLTVQGPESTRFWTADGLTVGHSGLTAGLGGLTGRYGGLTAHTPGVCGKLSPSGLTGNTGGRTAGRLLEMPRTATNFPNATVLNPKPNLEF